MAESHSSYVKTALVCLVVSAITVFAGSSAKAPVVRSDAEVSRVFREKLGKSKLSSEGIQIHVQSGVATLTGKTDIPQHKGTATRMAKSAGAREVKNQIVVSDAGKQRMLERMSSGRAKAVASAPPAARSASPKTEQKQTSATAAAPAAAPPPVRRAQVKHP